jgi:hypothetical protein
MKRLILAVALLALCVPALAQDGDNPNCKVFITFDGDTSTNEEIVSRADPAQFTGFSAWLGATDLEMGMTSVCLLIEVTPAEMSSPPSFSNLISDVAVGNIFDGGISIASTGCEAPPLVLFGRIDLFYLGVPGDIIIRDYVGDNPEWARWLTDCNDPAKINLFCIANHGGVGKDALPGDEGCIPGTPVEAASWTAIKALYTR